MTPDRTSSLTTFPKYLCSHSLFSQRMLKIIQFYKSMWRHKLVPYTQHRHLIKVLKFVSFYAQICV